MGARGFTVETHRLPMSAATDLSTFDLVTYANATTATEGRLPVRPIASVNDEPVGVTDHPRFGGLAQPVRVLVHPNIARAVAAATISYGEAIGYATRSSVAQVGGTGATLGVRVKPVSGASGSVVWQAGTAVEAANPGEVFSFYVNPRQLSGLA